MTDKVEDVVASLNINKVLIAVLEQTGSITVPTLKFLDAANSNKELVIDYDEDGPSFIFSLRDANE